MDISLVQAIVVFWLGLLLWILGEYLIYRVQTALQAAEQNRTKQKRIFWFTDTINDLNGVSVTLKNIGWLSHKRGDELHIIGTLPKDRMDDSLPPNYINLPPVFIFPLPYYKTLQAIWPSFSKVIYLFLKYRPDEVFISTPSAVGTFGFLVAKLFGKKTTAIYHTDFTMQALNIKGKTTWLIHFIEFYTQLFYKLQDRMLVPTQEYIDILKKRGLTHKNTGIFYRGIDTNKFHPVPSARRNFYSTYGIKKGINLLFAGRISEDKNIDFLIEAYYKAVKKLSDTAAVNLIFAGDGPAFEKYAAKYTDAENIYFLGYIDNYKLPEVYSAADLLVFPSETDTFGMAVLEAQSCGIPALVSHIGGPRHIVQDGSTGFILPTDKLSNWTNKLTELVPLIQKHDTFYRSMSITAREHVLKNYDFYRILDNYLAVPEGRSYVTSKSPRQVRDAG